MPGDEDPILADGNPHPAHGVPLAGNPNNSQNWQHDQAGAGEQVLGDIGMDVQMMQDINLELNPMNQNQGGQNPNNEAGMQGNEEDDQMEELEEIWVP